MTVVNKYDKAKGLYYDALTKAIVLLATPRATAEARAEVAKARAASVKNGRCAYCGKEINFNRSSRHLEACDSCGKLVDRMLAQKSKVVKGSDDIESVKNLHGAYMQWVDLNTVPYALRGTTGNAQDIVDALVVVMDAYTIYHAEYKARIIREAEAHVAEARRQSILDLLVQCGADPTDEATLRRVEEIYYGE